MKITKFTRETIEWAALAIFVLALLQMCIGCGGSKTATPDEVSLCRQTKAGFVNHTRLKMPHITAQWEAAKEAVGVHGVPDNAFSNPPSDFVVDGRALTTDSDCTIIESKPDILVAELGKKDPKWLTHHDPSGAISNDGNLVHSYVDFGTNPYTITSADSLLEVALEYEMENIILHKLGYHTNNR